MDNRSVNSIASIYGLDNVTAWMKNQTDAGKEFYSFDKKRAEAFFRTYGYSATVGEMNSSNIANISQPGEEVNSKFSRRASDDTMTKEQAREQQISRAELLRENEALRQRAEYWKGQTQLTKEKTVRNTDTHKFARDMAETLDVKNREAVAEFEDAAQHIGNYIVQSDSETLDYDTLHTMASETADILLSNSEVEVESGMEEQLGELADYIKTHKLKVNETELKDLPKEWLRQHRRALEHRPN